MTAFFFLVSVFSLSMGVWALPPNSRAPDTQWTYKSISDKDLKMDVFLPAGYQDAEVSYPVMVIFHGGSWTVGETNLHWPDGNFWAKRGMIAVSVDYRLRHRDQVQVPLECVKDAKSAIRYLRANAKELKIDPSRVVAKGDSAGGQLAAATATLTDPKTNDDCFDLSISCVPQAVIRTCPWFKTSPDMCPPKHLREGLPPFLTFAGGADHAIPVSEMEEFHQALKAKGIPSELYIGNQGKHGFCNGRNPYNRFFYWSISLADQFLVKHGILEGVSNMTIPKEVKQLKENDFQVYQ